MHDEARQNKGDFYSAFFQELDRNFWGICFLFKATTITRRRVELGETLHLSLRVILRDLF